MNFADFKTKKLPSVYESAATYMEAIVCLKKCISSGKMFREAEKIN